MSAPSVLPLAVSGRSALEVARACAREAGKLAFDQFRRPQQVTVKGRGNLLTETDLAVETYLHDALGREFPNHRMLSEETASETDTAGWVWVIDPLDGTRNFVSGIPIFCTNLALCHDGEPLVAVTYDPNHDEAFWAERGHGAWLNDQPVRASEQATLLDSVLAFGMGYHDQRGRDALRLMHQIYPGVQTIRNVGSAALGIAYAACGRFDLILLPDEFPWDIAAGILLVREAGGTITDLGGQPATISTKAVIAGGPKVHDDFFRWRHEHDVRLGSLIEV